MSTNKSQEKIVLTPIQPIEKVKRWVFIIVFVLINYFAIRNFLLLSTDMIYGNYSAQKLVPAPAYLPMRIPKTPTTREYQAVNRLGADFASIYFPAQDISALQNAYNSSLSLDPWQRSPNYAPLILGLCSITLCKLSYGYASFGNILIQLLLFFSVFYFVFRALGTKNCFLPVFLFIEFCLFVTPAGLSWFERGQFSLYVAIAYLLLLIGLIRNNPVSIVLSAVFAFIKWTSLPFIFVILAIYLLSSKNKKDLQYSLLTVFLFSVAFGLLLLPFMNENILFLQRIIYSEAYDFPVGISLATYFPAYSVKSLPLATSLIGYIIARIYKCDFYDLLPFLTGAAVILLLYPTQAWAYSIPTILGFIPLMIFWTKRLAVNQRKLGNLLLILFALFVAFASFWTKHTGPIVIVIVIYLAFSAALMISPIILAKYFGKPVQQAITSEK